jgi:predicted O-methyltransferase YrrM
MHSATRSLLERLLPVFDVMALPFIYPAALLLKAVRHAGVQRLPLCKLALRQVGVFPIRRHYYEPLFDEREIRHALTTVRGLPGIDWNVAQQLEFLKSFRFAAELEAIPVSRPAALAFYMDNGAFESGDAEYWYSVIRLKKPRRIVEIGAGFSTLMALEAIRANEREEPRYRCRYICVEPFERPWLERTGVEVIRQRVEDLEQSVFSELGENDVLFIDSSHVIRPQGDVVFEYLDLLPSLRRGVIVHVHDIFSPRDYPDQWLKSEVRLWTEQYLVEAFLTCNRDWKILGALNFLRHAHYELLKAKCPFLAPHREPASLYIQKVA